MSETPLRVAIVGAGQIASGAHLPAWRRQPAVRLSWIVDSRRDQAMAMANRWGIEHYATDYRELLTRDDIDAVDICLPANLHGEASVQFLLAGKHVLVEKPVATTLADASRMKDAAEKSGCVAMVAENWPFASAPRRVLQLVLDGELGELFLLSATHLSGLSLMARAHPDMASDLRFLGYLFAAGIHSVNLARVFMGEFASLTAYSTSVEPAEAGVIETDLVLAARFRNGGIGSFVMTGRSQHFRAKEVEARRLGFDLYGEKGIARFDVLRGDVLWTNSQGVETVVHDPTPSMGYAEEVAHFVECITRGRQPLTSISDQALTLAAVLSAYRSLEEGTSVAPDIMLRHIPGTA